jgi:glycosyltransferase involved in cell wall biosynthesis
MKIAIAHQGFIPHYRVRFFELLDERAAHDYVVFHGEPPSGIGHYAAEGPFFFPNVKVNNRELRIAGKSLIYQGILRRILRERFDAVILGTHVQFLSNHLVLLAYRGLGRPVFYWGHAKEKTTGGNRLAMSLSRSAFHFKNRTIRMADGYLAYTQGGAERLATSGFDPGRVAVVGNTLDMDSQIALHREMLDMEEGLLRAELGLARDSVVLVYVGRIYAEKRVDELIESVQRILAERRGPAVEVVVIGDGPDASRVREVAGKLPFVQFTGELRDQAQVARYLRVASAVVVPGALGLAVNHALAHGLPVISRWTPLHGPEIEYLTPGRDSIMVEGEFDDFVAALRTFVMSPGLRSEMASAAIVARERLSIEAMVQSFDAGVSRLLAECAGIGVREAVLS